MIEPIETELFGIVHGTQSINQKRKGNRNELEVTKILTEWTGHEFTRIPRSGGLRWKNRMNICGDVISTDPDFQFIFNVETKHVARLGLKKEVLRENSVIYNYFKQCQRDATVAGKKPMLIVRQNGMKKGCYFIFLSLNLFQYLDVAKYVTLSYTSGKDIIGYASEKFFNKVSYETLKSIYNE